jgi:hypothetical protein
MTKEDLLYIELGFNDDERSYQKKEQNGRDQIRKGGVGGYIVGDVWWWLGKLEGGGGGCGKKKKVCCLGVANCKKGPSDAKKAGVC